MKEKKQIRQTTIHSTFQFAGKPAKERKRGEVEPQEREAMDRIEAVLADLHEEGVITTYRLRFIQ